MATHNAQMGIGPHSANGSMYPWFPLQDNAANTIVDDLSSTDDNGVWNGGGNTSADTTTSPVSWMASALAFNGSRHVGSFAVPLTGTGAWTFRARFKTTQTATGQNNTIMSWGATGAGQQFSVTVENGVVWSRNASGNTASAGTGLNDGNWHNVTIAKAASATTSGLAFRVDKSSPTPSTAGATAINLSGANGPSVGQYYSGVFRFVGDLSDISFEQVERSSADSDEWEDGPEPVNTVAPAVSGTETQGQILSCTSGTWGLPSPYSGSNGTITYAYQWTRSDDGSGTGEANIGGATSSTYTLQAADVGKYLRCYVRASNDGGYDVAADTPSAFTGAIAGSGGGATNSGQLLLLGCGA